MKEEIGLISVIVPVYKVEQYLERCVNSILNQTYSNFELILVDDGSPDRCGEICDFYAQKDKRVRVIHKENGGLSDARNAGLKICMGNLIVFVDSDDWVSEQYLEILYDMQQKTSCDIVECNIIRTDKFVNESKITDEYEYIEYQLIDALKLLIEDKILHQYVWNKLYRRETIGDIFFEKGKTNEDEFWTYQVFGNAGKIVKIDAPLYYYFQRNTSIMGTEYNVKRLHAIEAKVLRQRYIEKNHESLKNVSASNLFFSCLYAGQMSMKYLDDTEYEMARNYLKEVIKESYSFGTSSCCQGIKAKIWYYMAMIDFEMTCRIRNIFKIGF